MEKAIFSLLFAYMLTSCSTVLLTGRKQLSLVSDSEAITFWGRMADSSTSKSIEFMSTHPSDENRIAQLKTYLPEAMQYYKK